MVEALDILKNCCEEPPKKRTKKEKKPKEVPQAAEPGAGDQIVPAEPSQQDGGKSGSTEDVADTLVQPETPQESPPARLQSQRRGCIVYM